VKTKLIDALICAISSNNGGHLREICNTIDIECLWPEAFAAIVRRSKPSNIAKESWTFNVDRARSSHPGSRWKR
jgi:hypothetical protein